MRELTLTLLLLGVVIVVAVRLIDLRTKLLVVEKDAPGLGGALEVALRSVSRDLEGAFRGGVALSEAVRPVEDNTGAEGVTSYRDAAGGTIAVRPGTDQLRLRGVIRSSRLDVEPRGEPGGSGVPEQILKNASSVSLWAGVPGGPDGAENLQSVIEHLGDPARRSKRFFLVADSKGSYAVALVKSWSPAPAPARTLELLLDFTDSDAVRENPGDAGAARALGQPVTGGLFDDLVWFVAQGPEGRPPDYVSTSDPLSMKFPHPYLAVATFAGEGRWEIVRVGEDVEELQVAWGLAGTPRAVTWRGDVAGSSAPKADELVDAGGRPVLAAVKVAMTAKAEHRYVRGDGPQPPVDSAPLLNAPTPDPRLGFGPVGWSPDESRRIPFERTTREVVIPTSLGR